jgi:streptogramin lyase
LKTWRLTNLSSNNIHEILPTPDGSVWLTLEAQGGLARFDPKTEKFEVYVDQQANNKYDLAKPIQKDPNDPFPNLPIPQGTQSGGARSHTAAVDHEGNIWVSGRPLKQLDVRTGKYTYYDVEVPDSYGIAFDRVGNIWFAQFNSRDNQDIGMVDVKTDKITKFKPPAGVTPRRLKIDSRGMVWVGDYFGGSLTRFDPTSGEFKVFKLPGPMPTPYGLEVDHDDNVWYASMYTDVMGKLDPKTGKVSLALWRTRDPRHVGRCQGPHLVRRAALFESGLFPRPHRSGEDGRARAVALLPLLPPLVGEGSRARGRLVPNRDRRKQCQCGRQP